MEYWRKLILDGESTSYSVCKLGYYRNDKTDKFYLGGKTGRYNVTTLRINGKPKPYKISVLVSIAFLGHKPCGMEKVVDHKNNIREDDFHGNLQIISNRENSSKDKKKGTSQYTGVDRKKAGKKWRATIRINEKKIFLGYFKDEYKAHLAYQKALKEHLSTKK